MIPRRLLIFVSVILLVLAACGGSQQTGDKDLLDFEEQEGGRVGEIARTTTTTLPPTTEAPTTAKPIITSAPPTTRPVTTTPPTTASPGFVVKIVQSGQGFDPFNFVVRRGSRVTVTNADNQPRTFTSDTGAFDSGPIAPGGSFVYMAETVGKFNFHDETRPFAVGQMEVVA